MSDVRQRCLDVLAGQLGLTAEFLQSEFTPGMDLAEAGLLDELDLRELVMAAEEEFDIELALPQLRYDPRLPWTMDRLVRVVEAALAAKGAAA